MASRVGPFEVILFFLCLNLSCYLLTEIEALPFSIEGIETPETMMAQLNISVFSGIAIVAGGTLVGLLLNSLVQAAAIALVLAAINFVLPILNWVLLGFPVLLALMGVPVIITTVLSILISAVFFWFLIGMIAQRYME